MLALIWPSPNGSTSRFQAPSIPPHFILQEIEKNPEKRPTAASQLIWMGTKPECNVVKKKGMEIGSAITGNQVR